MDEDNSAYIVEAVRSAGGRRGGRLSGWHPADIGAMVCDALLERAGVDGALVDDVAWGCVTQSGAQAENAGRNVVLSSKRLPDSVPAYTVDRQCGSAQQALHLATQAVMSGTQDIVIAGGVEMMSVVPMDSNVNSSWEGGPHTGDFIKQAYGQRMQADYTAFGADPVKFDQFVGAELVAQKYNITRDEADAFALRSHRLAAEATKAGRYPEIVPIPCKSRAGISKAEAPDELHAADEGIRPNASLPTLSKLKPILKNGTLTAAAASQLCDGASAMLVCNARGLRKLGVAARARVVALGLAGLDPVVMLEGPIPATQQALRQAGLSIADIDLVEVNEAFSSVPLAWAKAMTGGDLSKVNVNGGAIARGHPMGATGGMLMANLIGELERRQQRYGLLTMCESGGTANATIVERVAQGRVSPLRGAVPRERALQCGLRLLTLGQALHAVARWKADAPALTALGPNRQAESMSFRELDARSSQLARAYAELGVQRNDYVTICLPSGPEVVMAAFACWKLGATPNNVSGGLPFRERDAIIRLANPKLVVGVPSRGDPAMQLHEGYKCVPEGFAPDPRFSTAPLPDVFANSWLVATSGGSTGRPKLIILNEPSLVMMRDLGGGRLVMPDGFNTDGGAPLNGVDLIPCPLSHNAPFHCAVQGVLGASHQILMTKFEPELMLRTVQDYRCNFAYLVPTIMKRVWDLPQARRGAYDVSSLQGVFHMAAPCPPWLKEAWCHWLGPEKVFELYGATEAMSYTLIRGDEWLQRAKFDGMNLVGRPACGEIKIVDPDTRRPAPPGVMGEVWSRHHERRCTYYYRGAVSQPDEDGWETCGDIGLLDADGFLHLGDRKADMVVVNGVNVYPAEVEAALELHPAVRSAVVVGVPDADTGSALHAVVYADRGQCSEAALLQFVREHLARLKVPRAVSFVDEHLRGEDGKVRRQAVTAWVCQGAQEGRSVGPQGAAPSSSPSLNFAGRVAIVTGAGNGLGKEYAMLLAARGAKVVVNDLGSTLTGQGTSGSAADATVAEIRAAGGEAVANYDSVVEGEKIVRAGIDAYGRVDILVNNAGILRDVTFRKMTRDDWEKVYEVHLRGAFAVTQAAWRHMEAQGFGRVVNITSSTGLYGYFGQANYAAMKSAILGLTYTLALEGKKRGIKVNAVAPLGASRMMETVRSQDELKALPLRNVANLVAYLAHEDCKSTGGVFELGGHWMARVGWRRSRGSRFVEGFTLEDVAAKFDEISDFSEGAEYPEDADSGEAHSMKPPLSKL